MKKSGWNVVSLCCRKPRPHRSWKCPHTLIIYIRVEGELIEVIVPLALPGLYTYRVPAGMAGRVAVGCRVVVPFGGRKHYTAIVVRVGARLPAAGVEVKDVAEVVDDAPLVLPAQLDFWMWLAHYYMCTPGEVMRAALPSGLKLESESEVRLNPDFDPATPLTERERALMAALGGGTGRTVNQLEKDLRAKNLLPAVRRLMDKGAVVIKESMAQRFRPKVVTHVRLTDACADEGRLNALFAELGRAPKQAALLTAYLDMADAAAAMRLHNRALLAEVAKADLLRRAGVTDAVLAALTGRGVLETYPYEVGRLAKGAEGPVAAPRPLSDAQQKAADEVVAAFARYDVCLLHGVTSSGKTEIYAHLIARELEAGRQVLYLVPEIALTTQLTDRLSRLFGGMMGVYHSKFPDAERVELWRRQMSDKPCRLVLGVRSSLFLPFRRLGLVIVDEEHETSYKQQDPAPRYHARDAAVVMARMAGAKVLLGTATPSVETYHNAMTGKYGLVRLSSRYGDVRLPEIEVEDVKELRRKKMMPTPFSPRLLAEMRSALERREQVILFQNRRGYSPVVECRSCGWVPRCQSCDVSLTFHRHDGRMACHYCGASYPAPRQCPQCGGTDLRGMGYGTEKIEEAVRSLFPGARTARMDLDTTRSRSAYERILADFAAGRTDVLVGTQMVTKGLDFERVRVVGILNADQLLNQPDFRAYERAFQMMAQVAGRAGRRGQRGLVVLQTSQPGLPVIGQVVRNDYDAMYAGQLAEREAFGYPPACRLVVIYVKHRVEASAEAAAKAMAGELRPAFGAALLGPEPPLLARLQAQYIQTMMLKLVPGSPLAAVREKLWEARERVKQTAEGRSATIYFDVDPA